jgi:hypothetical protein
MTNLGRLSNLASVWLPLFRLIQPWFEMFGTVDWKRISGNEVSK